MNVFLSKFDSQGSFKWVRTWGGLQTDDAGGAVVVDKLDNVYAGGRFNCTNCNFNGDPLGVPLTMTTSGRHDGFVSKYDSSGNFQWAKTWGGSTEEFVGGLLLNKAGNIYATGVVSGVINPSTYAYTTAYSHIAELTSSGTTLWSGTWGVSGYDTFNSPPALDVAGNLYVAGSFENTVNFNTDGGTDNKTATGTGDAYLMKFIVQSLPRSIYLPLVVR